MSRILLIEDNDTSRELLAYLLRALGHTLTVAEDGIAGVEAAIAETPDLVICDIQLPKLDGFAVLKHLLNNPATRDVPVVALTASAMVGDREKMLSAGFSGYVAKPVDPEEFGPLIEGFLAAREEPFQVPGWRAR